VVTDLLCDYASAKQAETREGGRMITQAEVAKIIGEKNGIKLELGGGNNPNTGFFNIDILPLEKVDLVWDLERTPWPLPDECALQVVASHVLEHLNPHSGDKRLQGLVDLLIDKGIFTKEEGEQWMGLPGPGFINVMNEVWRVLKPKAQFAFVVPYAESQGMFQDPTHTNFINETTMLYFDPLDPSGLYSFYHPKPWKVQQQFVQKTGLLEIIMSKRPWDDSYAGVRPPQDIIDHVNRVKELRVG
jgi:SAM-dependent methyltransferase